MSETYLGPITTRDEAFRVAARIEKNLPRGVIGRDAVAMLRRNWRAIAARPEIAADFIELAEWAEGVGANNEGGVR